MIARELTMITTTSSNNSRIEKRSFDRCHRIMKLLVSLVDHMNHRGVFSTFLSRVFAKVRSVLSQFRIQS